MTSASPLTHRGVFRTWWPLAGSWLLMGAELPAVSAVMARLAQPEVSLAAYGGVVFPLSLIIEAPIIMLLAASTALSRDRASYLLLRRFMFWSGFALTAIHALIAFTPLFDLVVGDLMGAPESIREPARIGLMIMTPWTWSIAYRRFQHGVLIRFGHSKVVGLGTVVRLATNGLVLAAGYLHGGFAGIVVGTTGVAVGVTLEALFTGIMVRPVLRGPLAESPRVDPPLTAREFVRFYTPLGLTSLLTLAAPPILSSAVARMPMAVASLAVFPVINGLTFLLRSLGFAYNEVVVAHLETPGAIRTLRRFAVAMAVAGSVVMLLLAATPLGWIWFAGVSGLSRPLAELATSAVWIVVAMPGLSVGLHFFQGVLLHSRRTPAITQAVVGYLLTVVLVLAAGVALGSVTGLYVGLTAMLAGMLAQTAWLWHRSRGVRRDLEAVPPPGA